MTTDNLAEEHRIVTCVDELMQLCDQVEAAATYSREESPQQMDSIMHHLFAPAWESAT